MRRIQVDFNSMVGSVVLVPRRGEPFAEQEAVVLFDESTEDYAGVVVAVTGAVAFVEAGEATTTTTTTTMT